AADVLVELDRDLAVFEPRDLTVPDRRLQLLADRLRQLPAGVSCENTTRLQCDLRFEVGMASATLAGRRFRWMPHAGKPAGGAVSGQSPGGLDRLAEVDERK